MPGPKTKGDLIKRANKRINDALLWRSKPKGRVEPIAKTSKLDAIREKISQLNNEKIEKLILAVPQNIEWLLAFGLNSKTLKARGFSMKWFKYKRRFSVEDLRKLGFRAEEILKEGIYTEKEWLDHGLPIDELLEAHVPLSRLIELKVPIEELMLAGVTIYDLMKAGVSSEDLSKIHH